MSKNTLQRIIENDSTLRKGGHGNLLAGLFPKIECNDGATLSVQAGYALYSTPRANDCEEYTHVEVGYPNPKPPKNWNFYGGSDGVYSFVPVSMVANYIKIHGGEKGNE